MKVRRRILAISLLAFLWDWAPWVPPVPVEAQSAAFNPISATLLSSQGANTTPTALCSGGQAPPCTLDVSQATTVMVQVSGTLTSLTVNFQSSLDRTNWNNQTCYTLDSATAVTSTSATGIWRCNVSGATAFRVTVTSFSSGSVTVVANTTSSAMPVRDATGSTLISGSGATNTQGLITGTAPSGTTSPTCAANIGCNSAMTPAVSGSDGFIAGTFDQNVAAAGIIVFTFGKTYATAPRCLASTNYVGRYVDYVTTTTTTVIVKLAVQNLPWEQVNVVCFGTTAL